MSQSALQAATGELIKQVSSQAVSEVADMRARVRDMTLSALQRRHFHRHGLSDGVRAVTQGGALGAEQCRADMRRALSDAFGGLDLAITRSTQADQEASRQLSMLRETLSTMRDLPRLHQISTRSAGPRGRGLQLPVGHLRHLALGDRIRVAGEGKGEGNERNNAFAHLGSLGLDDLTPTRCTLQELNRNQVPLPWP